MSYRRIYNFDDFELKEHLNVIISQLEDYISDFEVFGFDAGKLALLKQDLNDFYELSTDNHIRNNNFHLTYTKNKVKKNLYEQLKMMRIRVAMKYGEDSVEFRNLELKKINYQSDNELISIARNVYSNLFLLLPEMSEVGLTSDILESFKNLTDEFENSKNQRNNAANERIEITKARIDIGNKLYNSAKLIAHLAKLIYSSKEQSKAAFYQLPKVKKKSIKVINE